MQAPPASLEEQCRWLVERAMINDLLIEHARCLDEQDWSTLQSLFTEDGYLELPYDRVPAHLMAQLTEEHLGGFSGTQHMTTNYAISIDGNNATARAYFLAAHRNSQDFYDHGDVGGWYQFALRRVDGRWRIASIHDAFIWKSGRGLPDETYVPQDNRE